MKGSLLLAGSVASCFVVGQARASDTMLHVTTNGNGVTVLVQETPAGRVEICKVPCDVKVDAGGEYRFVGAPGSGVRESEAFSLPKRPSTDLAIETRSQIRYVEGFVLLGVGGAAFIAGIVMMVVGHDMNQQTAGSGDVYIDVGSTAGVVAGLLTIAWGAGEIARNTHTRISASASQPPPPPTAPLASTPWSWPRAFALQLVSIRF